MEKGRGYPQISQMSQIGRRRGSEAENFDAKALSRRETQSRARGQKAGRKFRRDAKQVE
jgi:hypothetical protein